MTKAKPKIFTVSEINSLIQVVLQESLPSRLAISGQITDYKLHTSGHCYFSLKDADSQLSCVMWASKFKKLKFLPENGMAVMATGHIDVYTAGGKYQLYVDKLEPAGVGALQLAFEQMVRRLDAEGLFADEHKKPIPAYPMRIGIVTSRSAAALVDMAESIYNRWPCAKLFLYHVPVQGTGAAKMIAAAIRDLNKRNEELDLDVVIVGRGGGSLEDLWAFNEEPLARAIFDSALPIISAVGHEVDTTIADLVADARASTPTKAGVIAVPDMKDVLKSVSLAEKRLALSFKSRLQLAHQSLKTIKASAAFKNPYWVVNNAAQRVDEIAARLSESSKIRFARMHEVLRSAYDQVLRIEPHRLLGRKKVELNNLGNTANAIVSRVFAEKKLQLTAAENRLKALDPRSVLNRGYSITSSKKTGRVITASADVEVGDMLITELAKADLIESEVKKKA